MNDALATSLRQQHKKTRWLDADTGTGHPQVDDARDRVPARGDIIVHLV